MAYLTLLLTASTMLQVISRDEKALDLAFSSLDMKAILDEPIYLPGLQMGASWFSAIFLSLCQNLMPS